jgi:hypothetical protein
MRAHVFRFAPDSGHCAVQSACPFRAKLGSRVYFVWGRALDHQLSDKGKPDPKRRAAVVPIFRRYLPMVRLDNGARDGQPHAHAFRLAGVKWFKDRF